MGRKWRLELSTGEREKIIQLIGEGIATKYIAERFNIDRGTVRSIYRQYKRGTTDR